VMLISPLLVLMVAVVAMGRSFHGARIAPALG